MSPRGGPTLRGGRLSIVLACSLWAAACQNGSESRTSPGVLAPGSSPVESVEPWDFDGIPGKVIRTNAYRLFTTETNPDLLGVLPQFLEQTLIAYTGALGPLPRPTLKLDTYLMASREQWSQLTTEVMGDGAEPYLKIQRGGFSSGGRAVLFTIGARDTLAIAAHEGWHQYTQRTFREELPVWLEEGIAVFMEGSVPDPTNPGVPAFAPWANAERYGQLVAAARGWQLISLERLLDTHPHTLVTSGTDAALMYYAQVWALVHFLNEGEGGKYRIALSRALADAAAGRLRATIDKTLGREESLLLARERRGPQLFRAYFNMDMTGAAREYDAFVSEIVLHGSKDKMMSGQSPVK